MVMEETDVNITRHKKKLDAIRERANTDGTKSGEQVSRGHSETSERIVQATPRTTEGGPGIVGAGAEGMESRAGTPGGNDQGVRSVDPADESATQSIDRGYREARAGKLEVELTPEQKAERERELTRQRVQRHRDAKREEQQAQNRYSYATGETSQSNATSNGDVTSNAKFQLKSPFKLGGTEKVKLFTKTEAEEEEEKIAKVFMAGTSLLDDVLEIIVKDHEPVNIWEMDEDEATLFAQAHLKRAQKDQDAARVARKLIEIHDKLLTFQYIFSRSKKTVTHVKSHGGFGFR